MLWKCCPYQYLTRVALMWRKLLVSCLIKCSVHGFYLIFIHVVSYSPISWTFQWPCYLLHEIPHATLDVMFQPTDLISTIYGHCQRISTTSLFQVVSHSIIAALSLLFNYLIIWCQISFLMLLCMVNYLSFISTSIFARLLNWNMTVLTNKSWDFPRVTKYHNHIAAVIDLLLAVWNLEAIVAWQVV